MTIEKNVINIEDRLESRLVDLYNKAHDNPENMSYWLPKLYTSRTLKDSILKIPETKIVYLNFETWKWLRSDHYTQEKIKEFNQMLVNGLDDFLRDQPIFMKTGVFSNKFQFSQSKINDRSTIGEQLLNMYYTSMLVGADLTSEVVYREFIESKEDRLEIYDSMPLHTEFRVFYDFDKKEVIGIANYWHPDLMEKEGNLSSLDAEIYKMEKEKLITSYNTHKDKVKNEVDIFMKGIIKLKGSWSIDVMKNGDDFWLIDMARMEYSALVSQMDPREE